MNKPDHAFGSNAQSVSSPSAPSGHEKTRSLHSELSSTSPADPAQVNVLSGLPRIDGIEFLDQLGSGGCGAVYLAHDQRIDRKVAIKILHRAYQGEPRLILQEARAQGAVEHPQVVPIYQVGQADPDVFYIVSKYLPGGTLDDRMRADPIPRTIAIGIAIQVSEALNAAHQRGLVHRDLKPSNILLDESGSAYVSDFGLALHEDEQRHHRNEISGTPAYMAPEQVQGRSHHLDGRTDVWALGVILYEMLTGQRPFSGPSTLELFEEIREREAKPLRLIQPDIPQRLEEIVLKCLRKNPADRYSTAGDLASHLQDWEQTHSADSETRVTGASRPRHPSVAWQTVAWVTALSLSLASGIWSVSLWKSESKQSDTPANPRSTTTQGEATPGTDDVSQPLTAHIALRVWGEGKQGISLDDPMALPLRNGDQVRLDVELSEPAHVYLFWVDASGQPMEIFPHDPELGPLEDKPRSSVQSPKRLNRGWPIEGVTGMETAIVLVRKKPHPPIEKLTEQWSLPPMFEFNTPREMVTYYLDANSTEPSIQHSVYRGLGKNSSKIDDPVLDLMERLQDEFDLAKIVRVAHVGRD